MSMNNFGNDLESYAHEVILRLRFQCETVKLNGCSIGSKAASSIFHTLALTGTIALEALAAADGASPPASQHLLPAGGAIPYKPPQIDTLRALYLADNDIHDRVSSVIRDCLLANMTIAVIDLGFNKITNESRSQFQAATQVTSHDPLGKRMNDLHVNLIGNKGDEYAAGVPNRSRSKFNLRFGVTGSDADPYNDGYTHISEAARPHYLARKEDLDKYLQSHPRPALHHIS